MVVVEYVIVNLLHLLLRECGPMIGENLCGSLKIMFPSFTGFLEEVIDKQAPIWFEQSLELPEEVGFGFFMKVVQGIAGQNDCIRIVELR